MPNRLANGRLAIGTIIGCLSLSACGAGDEPDILDAAAIYVANPEVFASIRTAYPGPFQDFNRVPARDPSLETDEEKRFIKELRKTIPLEFIDFFPVGDTGADEIDVVLKRYGVNTNFTTVSVIYMGVELPARTDGNKALFDSCDERAIEWFERDHAEGTVTALCRITENWYAYQKVS